MQSNPTQTAERSTELSARQMNFICILAECPNIKTASARAGIGRTTAHRWLKEPAFQQELTRQRSNLVNQAMGSVHSQTSKAVQTLIDLMDSENEWMRRHVSKDILGYSLRIREVEMLEERITALEQSIKQQKERKPA